MIGVEVGHKFYGFCGGHFGRDSYGVKTVVAVGTDFLVCREPREFDESKHTYHVLYGDPREEDQLADYVRTVKYILEECSSPNRQDY